MIGLMIRIRRDELHCGNRRRRVFRRLDGTMDIPEHAPPRQHKPGRDGPDLFEDLMGKQRREQPQDSIFADNPFLDGLFEWMDSPEGQKSIEVRDVLWNLLEHAQLDAKQRKLIWPDAERPDLEQSIQRVQKSTRTSPATRSRSSYSTGLTWATIRKTIPKRNSTSSTASQSDGSPTISE